MTNPIQSSLTFWCAMACASVLPDPKEICPKSKSKERIEDGWVDEFDQVMKANAEKRSEQKFEIGKDGQAVLY